MYQTMRTIKKILCPTDFSPLAETAARYAAELGKATQAKVTLVHVVFPDTDSIDMPAATMAVTRRKLEDAQELMKTLLERLGVPDDPSVEALVEIGAVGPVINQLALRDGMDLIVIGARGQGQRSAHKLFGNTAQEIVRSAETPVWVVPEFAQFSPIHTIVYATDLAETTPFHIWEAAEMLKPFTPIVRCVHVRTPRGQQQGALGLRELEKFYAGHSPGLQLSFHEVEETDVTAGLDDAAFTFEAQLVVMVRPRRSWLSNLLHHSQTVAFTRITQTPLLVIPE